MIKKFYKLLFYGIFISCIFPRAVEGKCNFNSSEYIEELNSPNNLVNIDIKTPKTRKYQVNFLKTLVSKKVTIPKTLKKKFNANFEVKYKFGTCKYKGKIWQNGDFKDHLTFKNGRPVRSINVKLNDGNILNAVRFKILIPETRNSLNEILGSLILKEMGYITPETFQVSATVNNVQTNMIFQEDSRKEMLERNKRREGPIFEGDETKLWGNDQYFLLNSFWSSLARLINRDWYLKGESSQFIVLNSFGRLQNSYLYHIFDERTKYYYYLNPNSSTSKIFPDYHFLMMAMNGQHALTAHNRKFYFNSFINEFEPIYYDGNFKLNHDLSINQANDSKILIKELKFSSDYQYPYMSLLKNEKFKKNLEKEFKSRVLQYSQFEKNFFMRSIESILKNMAYIQEQIPKIKNKDNEESNSENYRDEFIKTIRERSLNLKIIDNISFLDEDIILALNNKEFLNVNNFELSRILSRKKLKNKLLDYQLIYLPENEKFFLDYKLQKVGKQDLYYAASKDLKVNIDEVNKIMTFEQNNPSDWILFVDSIVDDWLILFKGASLDSINKEFNNQRFNKFGLTGCLNFYNANFNKTKIYVEGGSCEDSLNIVNSKGDLNELNITDAFQDAIDLDFSELKITNAYVKKANNDCIDLSGGNYSIKNGAVIYCKDKAISLGEKSLLNLEIMNIKNSLIGIAVKDLSHLKVNELTQSEVDICIAAFQKKQEFGGGLAVVRNFECKGINNIDTQSKIIISK